MWIYKWLACDFSASHILVLLIAYLSFHFDIYLGFEEVWMCLMVRQGLSRSTLCSEGRNSCFTSPPNYPIQRETCSRCLLWLLLWWLKSRDNWYAVLEIIILFYFLHIGPEEAAYWEWHCGCSFSRGGHAVCAWHDCFQFPPCLHSGSSGKPWNRWHHIQGLSSEFLGNTLQ